MNHELITIGRHSYFDPTTQVIVYPATNPYGRVIVGNFSSLAHGVQFLMNGEHCHHMITTSPLVQLDVGRPEGHDRGKGDIVIGHDVWIGRDARILSGVTIGTGAVVGAYAVVASDVKPYAVAVGNPARTVKHRFSDEKIQMLLASEWWEWSDEKIRQALPHLWSTDVEAFSQFAKAAQ